MSIDIGFIKPAFVLSYYKDNVFDKILIFQNIKIKHYYESFKYLNYFFSLNINKVIIEKQYMYSRNVALMTYIHGFFMAHNIPVFIVDPIAKLRIKDNQKTTRTIRKRFSVNIINNILFKQNFEYTFKQKDNDVCDALNLVLYNVYNNKDYEHNYNIPIKNIYLISIKDEILQ